MCSLNQFKIKDPNKCQDEPYRQEFGGRSTSSISANVGNYVVLRFINTYLLH